MPEFPIDMEFKDDMADMAGEDDNAPDPIQSFRDEEMQPAAVSPVAEAITDDGDNMRQIARLAEQHEIVPPDDHQRRCGVSMLFDVDIARRSPYNQFINPGNLTAIRRLTVFPLMDCAFKIPVERRARAIEPGSGGADGYLESTSEGFDFGAYETSLKSNIITHQRRTAKECADIVRGDFGHRGTADLPSLMGMNMLTQQAMFQFVLPVRDPSIFPIATRNREGYAVKGPFLDEIEGYFTSDASLNSIQRFDPERFAVLGGEIFMRGDKATATGVQVVWLTGPKTGRWEEIPKNSQRQKMQFPKDMRGDSGRLNRLRQELVSLTSTVLSFCHNQLNIKEDEIRTGQTKFYDRPNYTVVGAPSPPDLVMLAHTRRDPINIQPLAAAKAIGEEIVKGMPGQQQQAVAATSAEPSTDQVLAALSKLGITASDVAEMAAKKKAVPVTA